MKKENKKLRSFEDINRIIETKQDAANLTSPLYISYRDTIDAETFNNLIVLFNGLDRMTLAEELGQWAELDKLGKFVEYHARGMGLDHLGGYGYTKKYNSILPELLELAGWMEMNTFSTYLGGWVGPKKLYAFSLYMLDNYELSTRAE